MKTFPCIIALLSILLTCCKRQPAEPMPEGVSSPSTNRILAGWGALGDAAAKFKRKHGTWPPDFATIYKVDGSVKFFYKAPNGGDAAAALTPSNTAAKMISLKGQESTYEVDYDGYKQKVTAN